MPEGLVEVLFLPAGRRVWVQPGVTLLHAAGLAGVEIETGCTRGMCGTDPVRIAEGAASLAPPGADERGTLERMGLAAGYRLSCSAVLQGGPVTVVLGTF
jgi:ferredoxin